MKKQVRSKFIGKKFNGWTVEKASRQPGGHLRFTMSKPSSDGISTKYITVRDNELTALSRKEKTVNNILQGKEYCYAHKIYPNRNAELYHFPAKKQSKK